MSTSVELEALAVGRVHRAVRIPTDRPGLCARPSGAPGQPHRLQRWAGHGRGHRPRYRCCWTSLARQVLPRSRRQLPRHRLLRPRHSEPGEIGDWANYVKGVVWAIQDAAGPQLSSGFELAIAGNVPLGAGLSSSASLEAAIAFFLLRAGLVQGRTSSLSGADLTDPAAVGPGQDPQAVRERVRGGGLGLARPVFQPVRPGPPRPLSRLPDPRACPAPAGRSRAGDPGL